MEQHIHQLHQQPCFTARLLRQLQEFVGDHVVLHHADHELQQLRVFCPQQYFRGALTTWQSPELFRPMPHITTTNISEHLQATVPTAKPLPSPMALLISKRRSNGARDALSFPTATPGRQPSPCHQSHPPTPLPSTPRSTFHPPTLAPFSHLSHQRTSAHYPTCHQRRFGGFLEFNSVPQHRLIDAAHSLIQH